MDAKKVGEFIHNLRIKKNLTKKDLARRLNINSGKISEWENGIKLPDISLLKFLSKELEVTTLELMSGEYINTNEKKDANILLNTLTNIKKKQNNKMLIRNSIILLVLLIAFISYFIYYIHISDNKYLYQYVNNISFMPYFNMQKILNKILNKNSINYMLRNIVENILLTILISYYSFSNTKNNRNLFQILLISNLLIEVLKWITLIGFFDINNILLKLFLEVLLIYIYNRLKMKGGVISEKKHHSFIIDDISIVLR